MGYKHGQVSGDLGLGEGHGNIGAGVRYWYLLPQTFLVVAKGLQRLIFGSGGVVADQQMSHCQMTFT